METRVLGKSDLEVSTVCFGAWPIGGGMGNVDPKQAGVRLDTDTEVVTLTSAESSTTQWDIQLKNTALLPTNASISATKPIRLSDGTQFNWFQSFSQTTFALNGSEVFQVGLTLVHPAPPEPGL